MSTKSVLIDGDILVYKFASVTQTVNAFDPEGPQLANPDTAIGFTKNFIHDVAKHLGANNIVVALSDASENCFRKSYYPDYKANRQDFVKPLSYDILREFLFSEFKATMIPTLEADDVIGIWATSDDIIPGEKIIVSIDKDFRSVPCNLYNQSLPELGVVVVDEDTAHYNHMYQTLIGDKVDNYKGCAGIGPVNAKRILDEARSTGADLWGAVCSVYYNSHPASKDDTISLQDRISAVCDASYAALVQARLARILRATDFDFSTRKVIDWRP